MKGKEKAEGLPARRPKARRARSAKPTSMGDTSASHASSFSIQPEKVSLTQMLEALKRHDHLCLIYESQEEWRDAIVPFIALGLKRGEKCCYFADAHTAEQLHGYLQAEGVDVASTEASGQLVIFCENEAYTKEGSFDPDLMISFLITETEKAIAEGYPALRLTGEMTWVLHGLPGSERLLEYEAKLNRDFYSKYPALGICQYDRWKFDPEIIKGVIMTHPLLVRGNHIYHNFYYVPPEEFLNRKRAELEVQHWLNNVEREQRIMDTLRESEEHFRALIENSSDVVTIIDSLGTVQYQSPNYRTVWGRESNGEIGRDLFKDVHPDDIALVGERFNYLLMNPDSLIHLEVRAQHEDGSWRTIDVVGRNLLDHPAVRGIVVNFRDITERKKAQEELYESEEKFSKAFHANPNPMLLTTWPEGIFTDVNEMFLHATGYSREEIIGHTTAELDFWVEPDVRDRLMEMLLSKGRVSDMECKFRTKSGEVRLVLDSVEVINIGGQKLLLSIINDITEQRRAEEALRESEEKFRSVFDNSADAMFLTALDGGIIAANPAASRMFGYTEEEFRQYGRNIVVDASDPRLNTALEQRRRTGIFKGELGFRRKDGSRFSGEMSSVVFRDKDGQDKTSIVVHDLTERRQAEEALLQSEERYRTILEQMDESYYENDLKGNLTFVNDALCRRLGRSREELLGMSYRAFSPEEDTETTFKTYNQVYRTGEPVIGVPAVAIAKDGSLSFVERSVFPLRNEEGKIIGFRGISRDVTEHKKAEEERKQMELKAQITSRLASVGEMAAGVAHEINNPLTAVTGYAQLLMGQQDIPPGIRSDLAAINDGARRVAGIVQRLLAFSRQTKPQRKLVDINELIESTLILRVYHLRVNNIKVIKRLAPDLLETVVDPGQIQQVLLNLIVNAETEMKLAHGKGKLTITTEKSDNTIKICVKDNGPGIKPEVMDTIFDPFFTTREVGEGTGLGLSLCYGIVTEHKGKIYAESQPGKGATFIVELPVVTEAKPPKPAEPVVKKPKKAVKARILVVDDEQVVRDVVNRVLTGEGHKVETVDNAADALKKIESERYNLILVDIKMPGISGVELYKRIQTIDKSLVQKVVFITGDIMSADTEKFLSETKVAHIDKPFDAERLSREVQHALTRGR